MSDYRNEYERYYKNINRNALKKDSKNHLFFKNKKDNGSLNLPYSNRDFSENYDIKTRFVRTFIRQIEGSVLLLVVLIGLKAVPSSQTTYVLNGIKYYLNIPFEYDESIDAMNRLDIAGFKMETLHLENLKSENVKNNLSGFMNYLKNINDINLKAEN